MTEIAELIENKVRFLAEEDPTDPFVAGMGFPTGLSLNECAAHYTPNAGDKRILQQSDVLKVDIGVQCSGRICDSAFTLTFEEKHNPLLEAVRAATNTGIREAGIDARLGEIGAAIQETMESHEYEVDGKTLQVKCVQNLNGHNIARYSIHGSKSVPIVAMPNLNTKMEEGEYFAIETFGSTGKGYVVDSGDCSHYARRANVGNPTLRVASARPLLHTINKNFGSLPFCRRYLDRLGEKNYLLGLKHLVSQGIVQDYPPLSDLDPKAMTAQVSSSSARNCREGVAIWRRLTISLPARFPVRAHDSAQTDMQGNCLSWRGLLISCRHAPYYTPAFSDRVNRTNMYLRCGSSSTTVQ